VGLRHGLRLGRWLRTPRVARAGALGRMLYCKSVNGKRAHGALRCARCAQQMDDSERAAKYGQPFESHAGAIQMAPSSPAIVNGKSSLAGAFCFFLAETVIRRGLPKYGQPFESHAGAMQMAPSSPASVNGKSSLAGAFCFFLAETVGFEPTIQV
jgi:hypothetical protein